MSDPKLWIALGFSVLTSFGPRVIEAQYISRLRSTSFEELELSSGNSSERRSRQLGRASDYRYEGALIGGLVFGVGGALLGATICSSSDNADKNCGLDALKGGLLLGALGTLTGALVGGLFPKDNGEVKNGPDKLPPDSATVSDIRLWRGAAHSGERGGVLHPDPPRRPATAMTPRLTTGD